MWITMNWKIICAFKANIFANRKKKVLKGISIKKRYFIFQIVFNIVASVKFNEKLRDAIEINVLGTKKILDLVMEMENLKVRGTAGYIRK